MLKFVALVEIHHFEINAACMIVAALHGRTILNDQSCPVLPSSVQDIFEQSRETSEDGPKTYLWAEVTWCPENLRRMSQDCPGRPSRHQVTLAYREVPGLSWDVPHGIFQTPSHTCIQGCTRTVMVCPLWDFPGVSQHMIIPFVPDSPRHFIMSGHSWDMSNTCRQHWTSLDGGAKYCVFHSCLPVISSWKSHSAVVWFSLLLGKIL